MNFVVREKATAPSFELPSGPLELVMKNVIGIGVRRGFGPPLLDHIKEAGHMHPKVFKAESERFPWAPTTSEEQGAMVGERG